MTVPTGDELAAALARHAPRRIDGPGRRAAVALVLREPPTADAELLFIRRAEHAEDPWSGHVGFPGGRAEPEDESLEATAVRETLEETGLDLAGGAACIGALDDVQALARGRPVDLVISPFVFRLREPREAAPSHEVASAHWLPLHTLLDPQARSLIEVRHDDRVLDLPCLRAGGLVIWGLTFRMFENLVAVLDAVGRR